MDSDVKNFVEQRLGCLISLCENGWLVKEIEIANKDEYFSLEDRYCSKLNTDMLFNGQRAGEFEIKLFNPFCKTLIKFDKASQIKYQIRKLKKELEDLENGIGTEKI